MRQALLILLLVSPIAASAQSGVDTLPAAPIQPSPQSTAQSALAATPITRSEAERSQIEKQPPPP